MEHDAITEKILGVAFDVSNELGCGFLEKVYENALIIAFKEKGLEATSQVPIQVGYHGQRVGSYFADVIVNQSVIIEIKAVENWHPEHEAQIINYLKATNIPVGILLNFGKPKLSYRRFDNRSLSK